MFEVGETYDTQSKGKWECIAVTKTHAWMRSTDTTTAYVWTQEGKSASLGRHWDIKPQPREFWIYNGYASEIYNPSHAAIHVREVLE
jgi:hypothetical protein